jgi:hypothetical protein
MKIFLLKQLPAPSYGEFGGFVIIADTEREARRRASCNAGDEGREVWLSMNCSTCTIIGESSESKMKIKWRPLYAAPIAFIITLGGFLLWLYCIAT